MTVRSAWLLPGGTDPGQTREDTRLAPLGTMTPASELGSRDGVIAGGSPFAANGAGAMSLQIGIGRALVQGTTAQGAYPVAVTAPETLTFADGNGQFPRIDSVVARVHDGLYDTSGQTLATVEIIQGDPAAAPTAPALPAASLRLWDVAVPAGASAGLGGINWAAALGDRRRFTASYGGVIPRGWGLNFVGSYDGQYRDTGTGLERWSVAAAAWQAYPLPATPPAVSDQKSQPSVFVLSAYTDFTSGQWPPVTVVVPPSGAVRITVGAAVANTNTSTSTAWAGWRASGAFSEYTSEKTGVSTQGSRTYASRTVIRKGLAPGASLTITPQYNVSSSGAVGTVTSVTGGQLIVEMVPS
ncbi:hypothetical protein [Streptomyces sp. NBC_01180]|uniref:hypothetical protein n=1 Tax=Streptomyces sp. NBC_01180 TaxID=2903763 RepID=UPI00386BC792|nr:hypothetical protein OG708_17810 [Streptomyces sp. NBC_01180]